MPSITAQPLTHCPVCAYDLTGLPKNHNCPECGFEYEETMLVWEHSIGGWVFWLNLSVLVFWAVVMASKSVRSLSPGGSIDWFGLSTGVLMGAAILVQIMLHRRGIKLVIGDRGFSTRYGFLALRSYTWDQINFPAPGRNPKLRRREWWQRQCQPVSGMPALDRERLLAAMYDRWKRFQESQSAESTNQNPERERHDSTV